MRLKRSTIRFYGDLADLAWNADHAGEAEVTVEMTRSIKGAIEHRLEPATRAEHDEFARCRECGQLYWEGSHHAALRDFIASVIAAGESFPRRGGLRGLR